MTPRDLERAIKASPTATRCVLAYLDRLGIAHSGQISGVTLDSVCGAPVPPGRDRTDGRLWRRWVGGERSMPASAWRLLLLVSGVDVEPSVERDGPERPARGGDRP